MQNVPGEGGFRHGLADELVQARARVCGPGFRGSTSLLTRYDTAGAGARDGIDLSIRINKRTRESGGTRLSDHSTELPWSGVEITPDEVDEVVISGRH